MYATKDYRRDNLLASTKAKLERGKRLTKEDMAYEIGRFEAYHPACIYWDTLRRETVLRSFNGMFGLNIN